MYKLLRVSMKNSGFSKASCVTVDKRDAILNIGDLYLSDLFLPYIYIFQQVICLSVNFRKNLQLFSVQITKKKAYRDIVVADNIH